MTGSRSGPLERGVRDVDLHDGAHEARRDAGGGRARAQDDLCSGQHLGVHQPGRLTLARQNQLRLESGARGAASDLRRQCERWLGLLLSMLGAVLLLASLNVATLRCHDPTRGSVSWRRASRSARDDGASSGGC